MPDDAWGALAPEEKVARVREVWMAGISAAQLSARLSSDLGCRISRHAVIGLYHRNRTALAGVPLRPKTRRDDRASRVPAGPRPSSRATGTPKNRKPRGFDPFLPPKPVTQTLSAAEYDATALMLPLVELTSRTCRWPIGDPLTDDFGFCGHRTELGSSWCPHHAARLVGAGTNSERTAIRDAGRAAA